MAATRHRLKRWMFFLGITVLLVGVLASVFSWGWFLPLLERQASAFVGREVSAGHLDVRLGRVTEITLRDLRVANPPGFPDDASFAEVQTLRVAIDLLAYWRTRDILIPYVVVEDAEARAIARDDGTSNFKFNLSPTTATGEDGEAHQATPEIGELVLRRVAVRVHHAPLRADFLAQFEATQVGAAEPRITGQARGTYAGQELSASLEGGAILALQDRERPWPVDLVVENGPTRARLAGSMRNPLALAGADLRLEFSGPDMALLMPLTGVPIPQTPPYTLKGRLDYAQGRFQFTEIEGLMGRTDLGGALTIADATPRPDIQAQLRSRRVDLADLAGFIGGTPGAGTPTRPDAPTSGRVLPDTPVNFPKFEAANVRLDYEAADITGRAAPLDALSVKLAVVDSVLTVESLRAGVGRGEIVGNLVLTPQQEGNVHLKGDATFRRLDISRLMQVAGSEGGGALNGQLQIDSTGRSTAQLLGRGNGALTLSTAGGNLSALLVDLSGLRLGNAVFSALGLPARTQLQCFVADFQLQRGVLNTRALLLETEDAVISGTGRVRLDQERLDLRVRSEAKSFTIAAVPTSLLVGGTFQNPSVTPEIVELGIRGGLAAALGFVAVPLAILPTIELGVGDDPRCNAMLERLRRPAPRRRG